MRGRALPEAVVPAMVSDLERRVDEALATARASEAAVMTVGAAAFDAAEQARHAASLAERASAMLGKRFASAPSAPEPVPADDSLRAFTARADRVAARLRELERPPSMAAAA
jgi:hypothetical protein